MKQLVGVVMALLLVPCIAAGDIPDIMSYQGVLRDGGGNPVPDGSYVVTFKIYDVEVGGTALWTESQTLTAAGGIVNAYLGSVVSLSSLDCDVPYWLGVSIEGEAELVPRTALATVPYAAHAGWADTCLEGDDDWRIVGDDVFHDAGNVGIGTATANVRLDVLEADAPAARFENTATGYNFTVRAVNNDGNAAGFFSNRTPSSYPGVNAAVYGHGGSGSRGAHFISDDNVALFAAAPYGVAVWGYSTSNYSGYFSGGGYGVYVNDMLRASQFMIPTGAVNGYVLTSDASGVATWQPAAGSDNDWIVSGTDLYPAVTGMVGIGTTSPAAKLDVHYGPAAEALNVTHGYWVGGRVANFEWTATPASHSDILQLEAGASAPDDCQFIECERGSAIEFAVDGDGSVISSGRLEVIGDYEVQAEIVSDYASNFAKVLSATGSATGTYDVTGVYGQSTPADYYGIGGRFVGGYHGVQGEVYPTGQYYYYGVHGTASGGVGQNHGVFGSAYSSLIGYGVYGYAADNSTDYAGYFQGDVNVTGTLYGGMPAFRIDHPLDPEGKYLAHSAVQSDEMVNVYSGNATLDERGEATVEMPDWFEAVNADFRYQLTCIGGFAPVFVAETISDGRFAIAGGQPDMVVSWQVTGVRHDPLAMANPISVEQEKAPYEHGKYMHPEVHGMPATAAVHYHEEREIPLEPSASEQAARMSRERHEGD